MSRFRLGLLVLVVVVLLLAVTTTSMESRASSVPSITAVATYQFVDSAAILPSLGDAKSAEYNNSVATPWAGHASTAKTSPQTQARDPTIVDNGIGSHGANAVEQTADQATSVGPTGEGHITSLTS